MVVIDGRKFNITQIEPNKYLNQTKSAKEAQELAQALLRDGRDVTIVTKSDQFCTSYIHFNRTKTESYSIDPVFKSDGSVLIPSMSAETYSPGHHIKKDFEREYSVEEALQSNWAYSTGNTFLKGYLGDATVKNKAVTEMNQADFLSYVRENGLDKEINWGAVSNSFNDFTVFGSDFKNYTDYAGALYASLEERIYSDFSGEEQSAQIEKLDSIFTKTTETYSQRYAEYTQLILGEYEADIDTEKIKQSIQDIMQAKKTDFSSYVKANKDYAKLNGTMDEWLKRDFRYMAKTLVNEHQTENALSKGYSEGDLISIGYLAQSYELEATSSEFYASPFIDEQSVGLAAGMNYLTVMKTMDSFGASEDIRKIGEQTVFCELKRNINVINDQLEKDDKMMIDAHNYTPDSYHPMFEDEIYTVFNKMVSSYRSGKSTNECIRETGHLAYQQHMTKRDDAEHINVKRFHRGYDIPEANFWNEFYDDGRGTSYIGKLFSKWNNFEKALENKDYAAMSKVSSYEYMMYQTMIYGLYRGN